MRPRHLGPLPLAIFLLVGCSPLPERQSAVPQLAGETAALVSPSPVRWLISNEQQPTLDTSLRARFSSYWESWATKDWKGRWALELPRFRDKYDANFYSNYHQRAWDLVALEVLSIVKKDNDDIAIEIRTVHRDRQSQRTSDTRQFDIWRYERGAWYHVWDDPIIKY